MKNLLPRFARHSACVLALAFAAAPIQALAQQPNGLLAYTQDGYDEDQGGGPVRLARFSYIEGEVSWRPGEDQDWSDASVNVPFQQGTEIWLTQGSRAEVQFDDGSTMKLTDSALASFVTMYSDESGEFTEIRLQGGTAGLHLRSPLSKYQLDTDMGSAKCSGPAIFRVDDRNGFRVSSREGVIHVESADDQVDVEPLSAASLYDPNGEFTVRGIPGPDNFDSFCSGRDGYMFRHSAYLPPNIAMCAGDLDHYGEWVMIPGYGRCWHPYGVDEEWRPYHDGNFVWVGNLGYTWCGNEPWGYAPYHYGTWFVYNNAWWWAPGPQQQYWSPAVVSFSSYNGQVGWCPLAPREVHYPPTLSITFSGGDWAMNFSIGGCAYYAPTSEGYCEPHPWRNTVVNRTTIIQNNTYIVNNYTVVNNFHPQNASHGGGTICTVEEFHSGHGFHGATGGSQTAFFGHGAVAPTAGAKAAFTPGIAPTRESWSKSRNVGGFGPPPTVLRKPVFRAPVPPSVAQQSTLHGGFMNTSSGNGGSSHGKHRSDSQAVTTGQGGFGAQTGGGGYGSDHHYHSNTGNNASGSTGGGGFGAGTGTGTNGSTGAKSQNGFGAGTGTHTGGFGPHTTKGPNQNAHHHSSKNKSKNNNKKDKNSKDDKDSKDNKDNGGKH